VPDADVMRDLTFGGGAATSVFSPVVMAIILLAGILMLVLPRGKAAVPFFLAAVIVPLDQVLVVGSLHFPMLRLLIVFGLVRIALDKLSGKGDVYSGGLNGIDKAMMVLATFTLINGILLWREPAEVVYQLGGILTSLGGYTVLRFLIRDEEDVSRTIRAWAIVCAVLGAIMVTELATGKNFLYMAVGGSRAAYATNVLVRDGVLRARGAFLHPILAGTFGGFSLPLFVGLWWRNQGGRLNAIIGAIGAIAMCFTASSSTALMGLMGGVVGLFFWFARRDMRSVRRGVVAFLVLIQIYLLHNMRPVWHVIVDIDTTGSSSSWHRYMLIDECVHHFFSWFLVGTKDYGAWGWEMWDLSNQYVATADVSGLIPLVAFVVTIVLAFKYIGAARRAAEGNKQEELFTWALGASLFANVIAFIGISYFDQTVVGWYAVLAMICAVSLPARQGQLAPAPATTKIEGRVLGRSPQPGPRGPLQPFPGKNLGPIPKYNPVRKSYN
jgi:hypothetical protein